MISLTTFSKNALRSPRVRDKNYLHDLLKPSCLVSVASLRLMAALSFPTDALSLASLFRDSMSSDSTIRVPAEKILLHCASAMPRPYLALLLALINTADLVDTAIRQAAAIASKFAIKSLYSEVLWVVIIELCS